MTFMFMSLLTIAAGAGSELDADVNAALRLLADYLGVLRDRARPQRQA